MDDVLTDEEQRELAWLRAFRHGRHRFRPAASHGYCLDCGELQDHANHPQEDQDA